MQHGQAASTQSQRSRAIRLWDIWRVAKDEKEQPYAAAALRVTGPISELPASILMNKKAWESFASWLAKVYTQEKGGSSAPLLPGTLANYIQYAMQVAKDRAVSVARGAEVTDTQTFFACSGGSEIVNDHVRWFQAVKRNMARASVARNVALNFSLDKSALPVYADQVVAMMDAYASVGTADAAKRKCLLMALWLSAGRSGECCYLNYDGLQWDPHFEALAVEIVQHKTSAAKKVFFCAGSTASRCFFVHFGDMLTMDRAATWRPDEVGSWIFPDWHPGDSDWAGNWGKKVGRIIKDINPRDKLCIAWKEAAIKAHVNLPVEASAAGIRHGACTELYSLPVHQAVAVTGHDLRGQSEFFAYPSVRANDSIVGGSLLAGWPSPTYGHSTKGPRPARLDVLRENGEDMDLVEEAIDRAFDLDSSSPPMLRRYDPDERSLDAPLRPLVRAAFASLVMYYAERRQDARMAQVQVRLELAVRDAFKDGCNPQARLEAWGKFIREDFMRANAHMTERTELGGMERLCALVVSQGEKLAHLKEGMRRCDARLAGIEDGLERASQRRRLTDASFSDAEGATMALDGGLSGPSAAALPTTAGANGAIVTVPPSITKPRAVADALVNMPAHQGNSVTEAAPNLAKDVFRAYMEAGAPPVQTYEYFPGASVQKHNQARATCRFFYAITTDQERAILKTTAYEKVGERRKLCEDIVEEVRMWWRQAFLGVGVKIPSSCEPRQEGSRAAYQAMGLEWVGNRKNELSKSLKKAKGVDMTPRVAGDPDRWKVQEWRTAWEAVKASKDVYPSQWKRPAVTVPGESGSPPAPATQEQGGTGIATWLFGTQ